MLVRLPLKDTGMREEIASFVEDVSALVSPPEVWVRLNEVVNDPRSAASDVAEVIGRDTSLTARVLQIVNSPYYNFPSRVDTISRAVTILGTNDLFSLATAVTAARVFANVPCELVRPEDFWRHAICTGLAARQLARQRGVLHVERLYVAGLLHDIGSLVLYRKFPSKISAVLMAAEGDEEVLYRVEQDMFGFDHAEIGGALLELWKLPPTLLSAVRHHHDPEQANGGRLEAGLVHIANVAANRCEDGAFMATGASQELVPDPVAWRLTGLDPAVLDTIGAELAQELEQATAVFMPRANHS